MRLQCAPVDDHARGAAFLPHGERRNDDIGAPAIFFEGARMADQRDGLALHNADAAETVAAESAFVACRRNVAVVAVGE
jgi:hypothetical protein